MRTSVITLMTFRLGTTPLPLATPAIHSSGTVPDLGTSGWQPRCAWTFIHGVWLQGTPASSADTCHLPRCSALRDW